MVTLGGWLVFGSVMYMAGTIGKIALGMMG